MTTVNLFASRVIKRKGIALTRSWREGNNLNITDDNVDYSLAFELSDDMLTVTFNYENRSARHSHQFTIHEREIEVLREFLGGSDV